MKLWLVRHAQPEVESGICYGALDLAADATATDQCALALAAALPEGCAVISSPLQRCTRLAHALRALRPELRYGADARLTEMNFGSWEGQLWAKLDKAALQAWTDDFAHYRVGESGESTHDVMQRVAQAFDQAAQRSASSAQNGNDTVWITHAGVIRAATLINSGLRHISHAAQWPAQAPGYGQWCTLTIASSICARSTP